MKRYLLLLCFCTLLASSQDRPGYVRDNSDWWSILKNDNWGVEIQPLPEQINPKNFEIGSVALGPQQFEKLTSAFGSAPVVERGDASTGRHQVCYRSRKSDVFLIFEFGEVEENFYLFNSDANWKGRESCTQSDKISRRLRTASGVGLDMSRAEVERILGAPDATKENRIFYLRTIHKKTTPSAFAEMRRDYPEKVSDERAHEMFDYYDESVYIEGRFIDSRLNYLVVSRSDTT